MSGAYLPDFTLILPEIILILTALLILGEGTLRKSMEPRLLRRFGHMAIGGFVIALIALLFYHKSGERWVSFEGQLLQDDFVYLAKILILAGSAAVMALSLTSMLKEYLLSFEYPVLILLANLGMLLMVSANDFLSLFVGLELQGLSLYVLAALNRDQSTASEAALKYFVLGALATCLYLYGVSLIYGFSGSTNFEALATVIRMESTAGVSLGLFVGLIFMMAAFSFKVSAVPFHMWTPDVYQGCPTPITAFIAGTPKVAAMVVFLRLMLIPFTALHAEWQSLVIVLAFCSMVLGAFAALRQTDLKRLLAYSAIGQMGYALLGVAAGSDDGVQAVFVYLTLYLVMIVGTFGCLLCLNGKGPYGVQKIEDLSGIAKLHPNIAFILALFMFSLAGVPPLAGFFAKLYVFKAALSAGLVGLAIVGGLTSVVAAYYYLKIVKVMYFDDVPEVPSLSYGQTVVLPLEMTIVLHLCALITALFFICPNPLFEMAQRAALILPL
jgi:NADH-quinone oxidoreductase subunit N